MIAYKSMDKAQKIAYVQKIVPRRDIIAYQNRLAQASSYSFGKNPKPLRGFAGTRKVDVGLVFQYTPDKNKPLMMTIINDNGQHVTSFPISIQRYQKIQANDFWVLPKQPFN